MSSWRREVVAALGLLAAAGAGAQQGAYPGIGRAATPNEVRAWDIDVRPDFKGLPKGKGTVAQGQVIWEAQCASCHGVFGESNSVFSPIVGGTTQADITRGRVANLTKPNYPQRTTLMKLSSLSTMWDYIHRAMPWTQPKSLTHDEVYAVTAYVLNLGGIVPDDFELSHANIAQVQQRLPNRDGMSTEHGLWPGRTMGQGSKPDVRANACMANCASDVKIASSIPDYARDAHGNLAEQNRLVGAQRGVVTASPKGHNSMPVAAAGTPEALALAQKHGCTACHGVDSRIVGPGFREVASRHAKRADVETYLAGKIKAGGAGDWGSIPMPPQQLPEKDARLIAQWLATGANP